MGTVVTVRVVFWEIQFEGPRGCSDFAGVWLRMEGGMQEE